MRYTTKDLLEVSRTSLQSINKLFKTNSELKELVKEHKITENRNVYYDDVIYEWFCKRYGKKNIEKSLMENGVVGDFIENKSEESPQHTSPANEELEALKSKLEEITSKYEALQADFTRVDGERVELIRQNGLRSEEISHLLLLISQEKAEKEKILLMLPIPRKTIGERIRELFRKNRPSGKSI